jgi:hypothetical protein
LSFLNFKKRVPNLFPYRVLSGFFLILNRITIIVIGNRTKNTNTTMAEIEVIDKLTDSKSN